MVKRNKSRSFEFEMTIPPNKTSDIELLSLLKQGDQEAFRIVYDRYRRKIYTTALRMVGATTLAEEIMQETMLKFWQVAASLKDDSNIEAYLKTLARNKSYNVLRRLDLETKAEKERNAAYSESHSETEEQILLRDTRKVLQDGVALLPTQQKAVYQLCHQEGLKYAEAAEQLNLSPATVATHMKLALKFLRDYMSKHTDVTAILVIFKLLEK